MTTTRPAGPRADEGRLTPMGRYWTGSGFVGFADAINSAVLPIIAL